MTKRIKRYISAFLAAAVLCTSSPITLYEPCEHSAGIAVSAEESGSEYEFDATTGTITKYNGAGGNINIPASINGVAVTAIGEKAFIRNTSVTGVVIPEGVTTVGGYAFFDCVNITTLSLPTTLTSMEELAFQGCSSLVEVTIPANVTNFGNQAFSDCTSLRKVIVSEGITALGELAFSDCSSLTDVTLPSTLTSVSGAAFEGCTSLTEIVIPEGVTAIEEYAFSGCSNLRSVTLPSQLTYIGDGAFYSCNSLKSITIPESVTKIGRGAFGNCFSLKEITIPESVTEIGELAFDSCSDLDSIIYPNNTVVTNYTAPQDEIDFYLSQINNSQTSDENKQYYQTLLDKLLALRTLPETTTQIKYEVINGEVTITEIILPEGKAPAVVPGTVGGKPVTSVAEEYRDKVSDSGHTHNLTKTDRQEPTCTEDGNVEYWTCSVCGRYFSDANGTNIIPDTVIPAAHKLIKTEEVKPTCTEDGNIEYWTCSVCNKIFSDENALNEITETDTLSPAPGHDYSEEWSGNDDKHWHKCTRCESTSDEDSHTGTAGCEDKAVCTVCGREYGEPLGHSYVDGICERCQAIDPDHTHRGGSATCTQKAECEICGREYGEPLGHSYVDGICERCQEIDPDHTHRGGSATCTQKAVCTVCGQVYGELGQHSFRNGICTVCGAPDPDYTQPSEPIVTEPTVSDTTTDTSSETEPTFSDTSSDTSSETEPTVTVTVPSVTDPIATEPTYTYTVPTFTQPPVTYPTYTPPAPAPVVTEAAVKSDREQPFIQGDSGKTGWDAISDIITSTPEGGTVTVDMNNSTMLPKDIVSQIKGRDIDLVLIMKNKFVWTINGTSVTNAKTVNMKVQRSVNISASTAEEYFGDIETVQIRLAHNGDFGFTAELSVSLGSRYNGMTASSYCYKAGKFSFGDGAEIADGSAKLKFDHASNWLIAITDTDLSEDVSADAAISANGDIVGFDKNISRSFLSLILILGTAFVCFKRSRQK